MKTYYSVNLYLVDRAFGGHEEGGWWFEYGEPILHPLNRVFDNVDDAGEYLIKNCMAIANQMNHDRASINSVLSEGEYRFRIGDENEMPAPFPSHKPHYE
jgi:hypothetical protein